MKCCVEEGRPIPIDGTAGRSKSKILGSIGRWFRRLIPLSAGILEFLPWKRVSVHWCTDSGSLDVAAIARSRTAPEGAASEHRVILVVPVGHNLPVMRAVSGVFGVTKQSLKPF